MKDKVVIDWILSTSSSEQRAAAAECEEKGRRYSEAKKNVLFWCMFIMSVELTAAGVTFNAGAVDRTLFPRTLFPRRAVNSDKDLMVAI